MYPNMGTYVYIYKIQYKDLGLFLHYRGSFLNNVTNFLSTKPGLDCGAIGTPKKYVLHVVVKVFLKSLFIFSIIMISFIICRKRIFWAPRPL